MKPTLAERDQAVAKTIATFWELISDLPDSAEFDMMPQIQDVAPKFTKAFPKIAASFDTNHMLHDIVADLLVSAKVPNGKLRSEALRVSKLALDPKAFMGNQCL